MSAFVAKVKNYPKLGLILLAYVAFIALGMPDGLLGVAWPSIRGSFGIPLDALGMLMFASTTGYMTSGFLSGPVVTRLGVGRVLAGSCALTGSVLFLYTLAPAWWTMVLLGVGAGLGAGAIDAGLNTYIAAHFGEGVMQWLHASYGIGITLGPIIMTFALVQWSAWRIGYIIVGGFQLVLAASFVLTLPMWGNNRGTGGEDQPKRLTDYRTPLSETLRQLKVWLSAGLFFVYVGCEVALGVWAYTLLTESRGIEPEAAGLVTGSYWAMFTLGRIVAGLIARRLGVDRMVQGSLVGACAGTLLLWWNPAPAANLAAVALVGFSIAPVFPALMTGTSKRVGDHYAANTIGLQMVASGLGGATISTLVGVLARRISLEIIPICLVGMFLILFGLYQTAHKRP